MNKLEDYTKETFESIKHIDENGVEFWHARELQNYKEWRRFEGVISKAKESCKNSGISVFNCFVNIDKSIIFERGVCI